MVSARGSLTRAMLASTWGNSPPRVVAPAHLHLSAEEGAKVSQPALVSGALCSSISDVQNLQQVNMSWEADIAMVVHFLMYI